ncbi:MAG: adenylate/guanylate cyclase domain-containing protein, partial [Candidatus Rokuibacteriota bacterium]
IRVFVRVLRQLLRARSGTVDLALELLAEELMRVAGRDTYSLGPLCALVELGELTRAPSIAEVPYPALSRAAERGVVFSSGWMCLVPRVLGIADALGQRWKAAEAHFQSAIAVATAAGAQPELGRTYLDYARMLAARGAQGDRDQASELVPQAAAIFLELGMRPFAMDAASLADALGVRLAAAPKPCVESADKLSEREVQVLVRMAQGRSGQEIAGDLALGPTTVAGHVRSIFDKIRVDNAAAATAYAVEKGLTWPREIEPGVRKRGAQALRIILVSDVAASGALIHRAGDARAHELMLIHNAVIRQCLDAFLGTEVTHTGDGIEASFTAASSAVQCAIAIQTMFSRHNEEHPTESIKVRIGINAGEPIQTEGRLFGTAVHAAFGICARAQPGQILISDVVHDLVAGRGFVMTTRGRVALKGLPGRVRLYEVSWQRGPT